MSDIGRVIPEALSHAITSIGYRWDDALTHMRHASLDMDRAATDEQRAATKARYLAAREVVMGSCAELVALVHEHTAFDMPEGD